MPPVTVPPVPFVPFTRMVLPPTTVLFPFAFTVTSSGETVVFDVVITPVLPLMVTTLSVPPVAALLPLLKVVTPLLPNSTLPLPASLVMLLM